MSENSLTPFEMALPESRQENLTRQFYDWEIRGRGWNVHRFPVELEPPFRPLYFFDPGSDETIDDGRRPTFFSNLIEGLSNKSLPAATSELSYLDYQNRMAELDEPSVCDYYEEDFLELQIVLPKDLKVTKSIAEQLLLSLSCCSNPISFEVVATSEQITIGFASTERDAAQLKQQLKAYLPTAAIQEMMTFPLTDSWQECVGYPLIVDFGLSQEFMIPLNTVSSFDSDPLVSIVGALSDLKPGETGIFQVLFQKAKADWATEILDSVRFFDGTPFFSNAPEMISLAKQKVSSPLFGAVIRIAAKGTASDRAWQIVRSLGAGLSQLSHPTGNELIPVSNDGYFDEYHEQSLLCRQTFRSGMILNLDELVSLVHPPSQIVRSEKLIRESERTKAAPTLALGHSLSLGENQHQNEVRHITLSSDQRTKHIHVIGSSGSGKSTLLLNLITEDLEQNQGLCVIDPHGDLIDSVIANIPQNRIDDVILFDPSDAEFPIGFNILQAKSELEKTILSSDLVATFRRMSTSWGDVMDSVLANAILAFIENSRGGTLFDLKRFLVEKDFRTEFLRTVTDEAIRYFWEKEFPLISGKPQSSILIRLDAFLRQRLIRNIVCQKENKLDFWEIMDTGKILLIKLSQGLIGEENAYLLGTMLVSKLYQTAMSRQDSQERPYFWFYLDEFHHFITPSMESILSGARKYNLGLTLAHQEFRQLQSRSQEVASSVLSNCYTRICFRLGDNDAEKFASGFSFFDAKALQNLGVGEAIGRVERSEYDFNLKIPPGRSVESTVAGRLRTEIKNSSREKYARTKQDVETELQTGRIKDHAGGVDASIDPEPGKTFIKTQKAGKQTGAGGDTIENQHHYLQTIIKRIGEDQGFISSIEKEVFGGVGKVDVALVREEYRIACEIALTNTVEYEIQNIQKCLTAGFDRVVVISPEPKHLRNIKKKAEAILASEQLSKVQFLEPENFHLFLESLAINRAESSDITNPKIKGYKIKTEFKHPSEGEREARNQVILDVVSKALGRK